MGTEPIHAEYNPTAARRQPHDEDRQGMQILIPDPQFLEQVFVRGQFQRSEATDLLLGIAIERGLADAGAQGGRQGDEAAR